MKIDKRTIDELLRLPDDKLWGALRLFASSSGIQLAHRPSSPRDVMRIRRVLGQLTEADVSRAADILKNSKGGR